MRNTHPELNLPASALVRKQSKTFVRYSADKELRLTITIRHDDNCGNGLNTFAVTADVGERITNGTYRNYAFGMCHDAIKEHAPEFAHLLKWHLCSTDEPMRYVADTTYHTRTRTHMHLNVGDPTKHDTRYKFAGLPLTYGTRHQSKGQFLAWAMELQSRWAEVNKALPAHKQHKGAFDIITVKHPPADYAYSDNYAPKLPAVLGVEENNPMHKWTYAPFGTMREAEEWLEMVNTYTIETVRTPVAWCEAVEPDLDAARSCAIWEDATLEQLQDEKQLLARLPELMEAFKKDVESLGFTY